MQPTPSDIIRGVLENLEDVVFPHLDDAHAKSVAKCTRILLNHVILRLEHEAKFLIEDLAEKRQLLAQLIPCLQRAPAEPLRSLAAELLEVSAAQEPVGYTSVDELTAHNNQLKAAVERLVRAVYAARAELHESEFAEMNEAVHTQLRAQLDREHALVAPAYGSDPFPF